MTRALGTLIAAVLAAATGAVAWETVIPDAKRAANALSVQRVAAAAARCAVLELDDSAVEPCLYDAVAIQSDPSGWTVTGATVTYRTDDTCWTATIDPWRDRQTVTDCAPLD